MALSRPRTVLASLLGVVLLLSATACSAPTTERDAAPAATSSPTPSPDERGDGTDDGGTDDGGADDGQSDADGGQDPTQDRVRTGPVAKYGGPAYGDQGPAEIIEAGLWCKTITVFWGGDPVPEGVRFTFQTAVTVRTGLQVDSGVCGTLGADRSCLGLTVEANASGIFCSLVLRPGPDFQDGTGITFEGTLECPTAAICDQVAAREAQPGPTIIVGSPKPDDEPPPEQEQEDPAPEQSPTPQPEEG